LSFKPAHNVADLLVQHLEALEQEAADKGGIRQLPAEHFAKVYMVAMPTLAAERARCPSCRALVPPPMTSVSVICELPPVRHRSPLDISQWPCYIRSLSSHPLSKDAVISGPKKGSTPLGFSG
jgi:hypothetical protein